MNDIVRTWFPVVAFILSSAAAGLGVYIHFVARRAWDRMAADIYGRLNTFEGRLIRMETSYAGLPTHGELKALTDLVLGLQGDLKALTAEVHGLRETLRAQAASIGRINEYLLAKS